MIKLGQQARFAHKGSQPGLEGLLIGRGSDPQGLPVHTPCQSRRHVFLDGHRAVQGMVKRLVDHAKAAHPQKPQDFKLSQPGAGRQRINVADAGGRGLAGAFDHGEKGAGPGLKGHSMVPAKRLGWATDAMMRYQSL